MDNGDFVVVTNIEKMKFSGKKMSEKIKDPALPDKDLFGLIFVNFFPPINLPIE